MATSSSGKIAIVGAFSSYNGVPRNNVAVLNTDGSLYTAFDPGIGPDAAVRCVVFDGGDGLWIGGSFGAVSGVPRHGVAHLTPNGTLDATWGNGAGVGGGLQEVRTLIVTQSRIIIGGQFTTYDGVNRGSLAGISQSTGALDASFATGGGVSGGSAAVNCIKAVSGGNVYIGGSFTLVNGAQAGSIACLSSTGALYAGFQHGPAFNGEVRGFDGSLNFSDMVVVGSFSAYGSNTTINQGMALLTGTGTYIASQSAGLAIPVNSILHDVKKLNDGRILVCGYMFWQPQYYGLIRRLNANLSVSSYSTLDIIGTSSVGLKMLVRPEAGDVLLCGSFPAYTGVVRKNITALNSSAPPIHIKMMLQGPYNGTSMNDALRTLPSFPLQSPFPAMGYTPTEAGWLVTAAQLAVTGNDAFVDWVVVELRTSTGSVIKSMSALLQRDGDVVDRYGAPIYFQDMGAGPQKIAVRPRNHLPVMTATGINFQGDPSYSVDFTSPGTVVSDNDARLDVNGVMVLVAGDVSFDGVVKYSGTGNDRDLILTRVGSTTPNNSEGGYWREDVNMDGVVKYTGSANDRDIILTNVGSTTPNSTRVATLP